MLYPKRWEMKKIMFILTLLMTVFMSSWARVSEPTPTQTSKNGWKIGQYLDDFGDPTGEEYAYFIIEDGTLSNSATTSGISKVKVVARVGKTISQRMPGLSIDFQIHDHNWDNPVNEFFSNSTALLQFKDADNNIIKITRSNSKYLSYPVWNTFPIDFSVEFYNFLKNTQSIKASINCDNTKYNFNISPENFENCIKYLVQEFNKKNNLYDWFFELQKSENYDYLRVLKFFKIQSNNNDYAVEFSINGQPRKPKSLPTFFVSAYKGCDGMYHNSGGLAALIFKSGSRQYRYNDYNISSFDSTASEIKSVLDNIVSVADSGEYTEVSLVFKKPHDPLTISILSSDLKKYLEYPYSDEIWSQVKR